MLPKSDITLNKNPQKTPTSMKTPIKTPVITNTQAKTQTIRKTQANIPADKSSDQRDQVSIFKTETETALI